MLRMQIERWIFFGFSGIKKYIVGLIIKISSDAELLEV